MLCKWRKNRFIGDGTSTTYQLDVTGIDKDCTPTAAYLNGSAIPVKSYDAEKGTVTFETAPSAPENAGISNFEVKFAKTTEDRKKVLGCTIFAIYGMDGSSNRVFISGNKEHAAMEWFSGLSDPTYFPDINYSVVGSSDFPIMCYLKAQGELLLIKKDNRQEGTIWHHSGAMLNNVQSFRSRRACPATVRLQSIPRQTSMTIRCISVRAACMRRLRRITTTCRCGSYSVGRGVSTPSCARSADLPGRCSRLLARLVCACDRRLRVCGRRQSGQGRQRL